MGGSDDLSNLAIVTVEQHALLHKQLWEDFGNWQDEIAWKGLSKMIDRQEIISKIISNTHKGKVVSEETKQKMSDSSTWKGQKRDIATIEKMKLNSSNRGKCLSEDMKSKISYALKAEKNPMFGKTHSEEARKKISEAAKKRIGKKRGRYKIKKVEIL
jgi:hypothetical protein